MLRGGYCYGPLDPVSNIIINTIWFDLTFPAGKQRTLEMVSTKRLWRLVAQSLYGLVSFLCTRYQNLTPDQAMQRLLAAGADLRAADPHLLGAAVDASAPSLGVVEAYAAAATAAFHLNPRAQQGFLGSYGVPAKLLMFSNVLPINYDRMLSPEALKFLNLALLNCASSTDKRHQQQRPVPMKLSRAAASHACKCESRFLSQLHRVSKMVKAALDTFNTNNSTGPPFKLHIICGVNELVSGPEFITDKEVKGYNPWTPHKYHHSHINFLAVQEGQQDGSATLFFAEGSNHGTDACWCLPVKKYDPLAEQVRCIYCEKQGSRIVHTASRSFHGHDMEFLKVLQKEPLFSGLRNDWYSNDLIVKRSRNGDWVHGVEDDAAYANYCAAANDDVDDYVDGGGVGGGDGEKKLFRPVPIS